MKTLERSMTEFCELIHARYVAHPGVEVQSVEAEQTGDSGVTVKATVSYGEPVIVGFDLAGGRFGRDEIESGFTMAASMALALERMVAHHRHGSAH